METSWEGLLVTAAGANGWPGTEGGSTCLYHGALGITQNLTKEP